MFRSYILPWLVLFLYRLWTWTWRIDVVESESIKAARMRGERFIFAHWHGDELCIVPLVTGYRISTMTSTSKDGQLIDFVIRRLGGATSRGSSTRGGIGALKGLIRLLGEGYNASMAVDGPKGPLHKVKPGVFELSRLAKTQIIPVGIAVDRTFVFQKSWNKAKLPKPFANIVVYFHAPWPVLGRTVDLKAKDIQERLESEIAEACQLAIRRLTSTRSKERR